MSQKKVVILGGPTGDFRNVNILSAFTGPTGTFAVWQQLASPTGPTGTFETVCAGSDPAFETVIVEGYTP